MAEVIGHTFNKKRSILKNLFLKMAFNFEYEYEYVNAMEMYNIAIPSLKDEIYHYIKMLDKSVEGIAEEFVKVKSAGARSDHNSESSSFGIDSKLSGFFNYKNEEQALTFEPERVDVNRIWHTGFQG